MTHALPAGRATLRAGLAALAVAASFAAAAADQPSTYPGCATRELRVPWGGAATVDLRDCQAFGLGTVAQAPAHGTAVPGDDEPVETYTYSHAGRAPAGGGGDRFTVRDDNGDFITVAVRIDPPASGLVPEPAALPPLRVGEPLRQPLSVRGGRAPYAWSLAAGALPGGVSLDPGGVLAGTPTTRGPFAFTLSVRDAGGAAARLSLGGDVAAGELRLRSSRAQATPGVPFSVALVADGGLPPYRFQAEGNSRLPPGVTLTPEGRLSGLVAGPAGAYAMTIRVTDASAGAGDYFALLDFTLVLGEVPTVTLRAPVAAVAEDEAQGLAFVVTRDQALDQPTDVLLRASGSAGLASARPGGLWRVRIPAGAREARVVVRPIADAHAEPDESLVFTLVPASGYVVGSPARASGTLVDDDAP